MVQMGTSANVTVHWEIEDGSRTLFTLCKKSSSAGRRKEFRLCERSSGGYHRTIFNSFFAASSISTSSCGKGIFRKGEGGGFP